MLLHCALLVASCVWSRGAWAEGADWQLEPQQSSVVVNVFKSGPFQGALHDHHFTARDLKGHLQFDARQARAVQGEVVIPAESLAEKDSELNAADQKKVDAQLKGPKVLDVAQYPNIRVVIRGFQPRAGATEGTVLDGDVLGELTVRGVTKPIRLSVHATVSADKVQVTGETALLQSDFGIQPLHEFLGAIQVKDRLTVGIQLVAKRGSSHPP